MPRVYIKLPLSERFHKHIAKPQGDDGCWLWVGCIGKNGYGYVRGDNDKTVSAHRAAWLLSGREIEPGKEICHTCDVRNCVNPNHMFLGTRTENMKDASNKKRTGRQAHPERYPRGSRHPMAKLDEASVAAILKGEGHVPAGELADRFGVTRELIAMIWKRQIWRHVEAA